MKIQDNSTNSSLTQDILKMSMALKRKSAKEKMQGQGERKLVDMPPAWAGRYGAGMLLIPLPKDLDAEIRSIPFGATRTIADIRTALAAKFGGNTACPLVSGIFWRLCAEAAEEDRASGIEDICPYWRVIKDGGRLNEKLPGGVEAQAERLASEGVKVGRTKSGVPFVA